MTGRPGEIDGFGISRAFRRNELVRRLPEERQREIPRPSRAAR